MSPQVCSGDALLLKCYNTEGRRNRLMESLATVQSRD